MNLEVLLNDAEFTSQLEAVKDDPEEMAKMFNEKGIEVTAEDIRQAMEAMEKKELTEADLEDISGGWSAGALIQKLRDLLRKTHPIVGPFPKKIH